MHRSVTSAWLATCAGLYAAGTACSTSTPNPPPIEATGNPAEACALGNACGDDGAYCIAGTPACKYLECVGGTWKCPPDGGAASFDANAGVDASEAGPTDATDAGADAAEAAPPTDAPGD